MGKFSTDITRSIPPGIYAYSFCDDGLKLMNFDLWGSIIRPQSKC